MWRDEEANSEEALLHIKKNKKKQKKKSGKMPLYAQLCIYNQPSDRKSGLDSQICDHMMFGTAKSVRKQ